MQNKLLYIESAQSQNRNWFSYVVNDPVNYIDPFGLTSTDAGNGNSPKITFTSDIIQQTYIGDTPSTTSINTASLLNSITGGISLSSGSSNSSSFGGISFGGLVNQTITWVANTPSNIESSLSTTGTTFSILNEVMGVDASFAGANKILGRTNKILGWVSFGIDVAQLINNPNLSNGLDVTFGLIGALGGTTGGYISLGYSIGRAWVEVTAEKCAEATVAGNKIMEDYCMEQLYQQLYDEYGYWPE